MLEQSAPESCFEALVAKQKRTYNGGRGKKKKMPITIECKPRRGVQKIMWMDGVKYMPQLELPGLAKGHNELL